MYVCLYVCMYVRINIIFACIDTISYISIRIFHLEVIFNKQTYTLANIYIITYQNIYMLKIYKLLHAHTCMYILMTYSIQIHVHTNYIHIFIIPTYTIYMHIYTLIYM